jgi:2-polyprenyl-3-methyl-5-hydroxy-6-metoxy-1,4-benzoquinol methylase
MSKYAKYCYLCNSPSLAKRPVKLRDILSINDDFKPDVLECSNCGLVFLSSFDHISTNHYSNSEMHDGNMLNFDLWLKESENDDRRRFNYLKDKITNKTLLDFGCGAGGFINLARKISKKVSGIEIEKALHLKFKERGLNVFANVNEAIENNSRWEIVSAFHVLEHTLDPLKTLISLSLLLEKQGELIIEVPNINDALLTIYNNKPFQDFNYWSNHLFMFNAKTLQALVKKAGFQVNWIEHIQRYPLSNHLFWLSHGKPGGHKTFNYLDSQKLQDEYEEKLASRNATDTLILSASK